MASFHVYAVQGMGTENKKKYGITHVYGSAENQVQRGSTE